MSASGMSCAVPPVPQGSIGQEEKLIEQLSSISVNSDDPRFDLANRLMAVSFMYKMADCCSTRSLEHIAANIKTPVSMLAQLAANEDEEVRMAVAENPSTPREILLLLARDQQADLRYSMAENANLPEEILSALCEDENPFVSTRAKQSILLHRSSRFTALSNRLNMNGTRTTNNGSWSLTGGSSIKRFITTLSGLTRIST